MLFRIAIMLLQRVDYIRLYLYSKDEDSASSWQRTPVIGLVYGMITRSCRKLLVYNFLDVTRTRFATTLSEF